MKPALWVAFALLWVSLAAAHSALLFSSPRDGERLTQTPTRVVLEFSEALEVGFSKFVVLRLNASNEREARSDLGKNIGVWLEGAAGLPSRLGLDVVPATGIASKLELRLLSRPRPGWYAVVWQVLSLDSHVVRGGLVFEHRP